MPDPQADGAQATPPSGTLRPSPGREFLRGLRRAQYLLGAGVVLLLVAIPAVDDLDALCRTLGVALLVVGALVVLATVVPAMRDTPRRPSQPGSTAFHLLRPSVDPG